MFIYVLYVRKHLCKVKGKNVVAIYGKIIIMQHYKLSECAMNIHFVINYHVILKDTIFFENVLNFVTAKTSNKLTF